MAKRALISLSLCTLTLFLLLLPMGCRHKDSLPQRVFEGHTDYLESVAFSPDGKTLATAGADRSVKLWDVATGKETHTLGGHTELVSQVVFAPDGKTLASASWDHTVRLWNPDTGSLLRTLAAHDLAVLSIAFSPDGKWIAGGSSDHTVTLWDAQTGKLLKTLTESENPVAFSPDGNWLATGNEAHALKAWKIPREAGKNAKWELLHTLPGHTESLLSVAFSPDGKVAGTGSADTDAILWNVTEWLESDRLLLHLGGVRSVTFTPDSKIFVAGAGHIVQFYNAQTGSNLKTLQTPFDIVTGIALSADAKELAVVGTFQAEAKASDREIEKRAIVYTLGDFLAQ